MKNQIIQNLQGIQEDAKELEKHLDVFGNDREYANNCLFRIRKGIERIENLTQDSNLQVLYYDEI